MSWIKVVDSLTTQAEKLISDHKIQDRSGAAIFYATAAEVCRNENKNELAARYYSMAASHASTTHAAAALKWAELAFQLFVTSDLYEYSVGIAEFLLLQYRATGNQGDAKSTVELMQGIKKKGLVSMAFHARIDAMTA